jgi:hypothetical protein
MKIHLDSLKREGAKITKYDIDTAVKEKVKYSIKAVPTIILIEVSVTGQIRELQRWTGVTAANVIHWSAINWQYKLTVEQRQ